MKPTRNAPMPDEQPAALPAPEVQAQQSVDQAVAASDEAMRAALGSTTGFGAAALDQSAIDPVAQADQALAAALASANAGEAAATQALRDADTDQAHALDAAQQQAEQATAAAKRSTSES